MEDIHGNPSSFTLAEDNCGPHRAKSIATWLLNKEMVRIKRPAQSPFLYSIENKWGIMKTHLRKRSFHSLNPTHLSHVLNEIWNELPDSQFFNIVSSIPKRV